MKIIGLRAENFARLRAVEIVPGAEPVVILRGENGAGKSSVLNAIAAAIDGGEQLPCPIRAGQQEASVELELADKALAERLTVTRRFWRATDAAGIECVRNKLTVAWKEGGAGPRLSPQATLDALVGGASFDPSEFLALGPDAQLERIRQVVGLDFGELDARHAAAYARRTNTNREGVALRARLDALPQLDAPAEAVSIATLLGQQSLALAEAGLNDGCRREAQQATEQLAAAERRLVDAEHEMTRCEALVVTARARRDGALDGVAVFATVATSAVAKAQALVDPDLASIRARIAGAEATNAAIRANADRARLVDELETKRDESKTLTAELNAIDADKAVRLAGVKFPVPGLGFGEHGVTLNGVPFEQASGAERIHVAMAIGIARTAKLKVVRIHEASTFDAKSLAFVAQMADAAGAQVWACTVAEGAGGFEIIDGEVVGPNGEVFLPSPPKRIRKMPPILDGDAT